MDYFDGVLARHRDTGIPKWGYYMDHFLDFVFMFSLLIGYSFLFDDSNRQLIYLFIPVSGCFMVSSYLAFRVNNEFKITYLGSGPTEIRIYFILLNLCIILFGVSWIEKTPLTSQSLGFPALMFLRSSITLSWILNLSRQYFSHSSFEVKRLIMILAILAAPSSLQPNTMRLRRRAISRIIRSIILETRGVTIPVLSQRLT